jgi:hypothetical protein
LGTAGFPWIRNRISKKKFSTEHGGCSFIPATVGAVDLFLLFAAEKRNLLRVTQLQMVHQVLSMFKGFAALFTGLFHHRPTYQVTTIETINLCTSYCGQNLHAQQ